MQRLTPCLMHPEDLSGEKKPAVTYKQDLPDCCMAMLFKARLYLEA